MLAARSEQRRPGRENRTSLCPYARRPASRRAAALCDRASARRIWPRRRGDGFRGAADQGRRQSAPSGEPRRDRRLRAGRGAVALRSGPVAGDPQSRAKSATGPLSRALSAPASQNMGRTKAAASGCSPGASLRPPCWTKSPISRKRCPTCAGTSTSQRMAPKAKRRVRSMGPHCGCGHACGDADTLIAFDADPLGPGPDQVANARALADRRRRDRASARLYSAESALTLTGAFADRRITAHPDAIEAMIAALAAELGASIARPAVSAEALEFLAAAARDLKARPERGLVLVGPTLSLASQALGVWINDRLLGPVDAFAPSDTAQQAGTIAALADALRKRGRPNAHHARLQSRRDCSRRSRLRRPHAARALPRSCRPLFRRNRRRLDLARAGAPPARIHGATSPRLTAR